MAITKSIEIGKTDMHADHWVVVMLAMHRVKTTNDFTIQATFGQWSNQAAYDADKDPTGQNVQVVATMEGNPNPTSKEKLDACEQAAITDAKGALFGGVIVV